MKKYTFFVAMLTMVAGAANAEKEIYVKVPINVKIHELQNLSKSTREQITRRLNEQKNSGYVQVKDFTFEDHDKDVVMEKLKAGKENTDMADLNWISDHQNLLKFGLGFKGFIYGGQDTAARVYFDKRGNLYKLIEINYMKQNNANLIRELINGSIKGFPAVYTLERSEKGRFKSVITWADERRLYILETLVSGLEDPRIGDLKKLAENL